ncbi:MAG: hypothetical protein Q8K30_04010 [Candidatus Gracilibacteria bacterium]|nr:hypothetical protein [Candidatus Gracilibacteria bacterium]
MNNINENRIVLTKGRYIDILVKDIESPSTRIKLQVQDVLIGKNNLSRLYDNKMEIKFNNLKSEREFSIYYYDENGENPERLNLDETILKNLSKYLTNRKEIERNNTGYNNENNTEFDCGDFVYFIKGWEKGAKLYPVKNEKGLDGLVEGDVICILNTKIDSNHHLAIYIGKGLFISKYGKMDMMISSYNQMKTFFDTNAFIKIRKED